MDYIALGKRVRKLRKKMKLTQEQLSEQLDISTSFLGHIERGTRIASIDTYEKLWSYLQTDANYLFGSMDQEIVRRIPGNVSDETQRKVVELIQYAIATIENMNDEAE